MDPGVRAKLIDQIQEDLNAYKSMVPLIRQYTEQGVPLAEAQNAAWTAFKQSNPGYGAGKVSNPTPSPDTPQPKPAGRTGSLVVPNPEMSALRDTMMNLYHGAGDLFGLHDRAETQAETQTQQTRAESEPRYRTARTISDFAPYAPTLALGPGAAAVTGMALGAATPADSTTAQIFNGIKNGVFTGIANKFIGNPAESWLLSKAKTAVEAQLAQAASAGGALTSKAASEARQALMAINKRLTELKQSPGVMEAVGGAVKAKVGDWAGALANVLK
jgi:hypothetical protein